MVLGLPLLPTVIVAAVRRRCRRDSRRTKKNGEKEARKVRGGFESEGSGVRAWEWRMCVFDGDEDEEYVLYTYSFAHTPIILFYILFLS